VVWQVIGNPEIHISWTVLATGSVCLAVAVGLIVALLQLRKKRRSSPGGGTDWSVPTLDAFADRKSFFHQWDPRFKVVCLFLFCFMTVSLGTLSWSTIALGISILAALACRIPLHRAGKRLLAMAGFLAMFLIVLPFTAPLREGETLVYLPGLEGLPLHMAGFFLALMVVIKACAVALMMEPLFATAPISVTLAALSRLGMPDSVGQMVLLSHRYIFVFLHEMTRMYRGMRVRGFIPATDMATMNAMGNFLGMLFVRSFERTQRVYDAMLCRGYAGHFPSFTSFAATGKDWAKSFLWGMMGLFLLVFDRIYGNFF
jgi:cobalt/nickel transport system permease protein